MDYKKLEKELKNMSVRSKLYGLVKAEMTKRGNWKQRPRGTGFKKGKDDRRLVIKPQETNR
jgi:hypothetical protein